MELKKKTDTQVSARTLSQDSLEALKAALKEQPQRSSQRVLINSTQAPRVNRALRNQAINQRRLNQIRNQEIVRQLNRVYQDNNRTAVGRTNGIRAPIQSNQRKPVLDPKSKELADYLAQNESLEGLTLEEALQKRIESLQRVKKDFDPDRDPFIELGSLGGDFSVDLRNAQYLSNLSPVQALVSLNLKELLRQPELTSDESFLQNLAAWLQRKKRTRKYLDESDLLELILIEFYPILLAALTKIFSRGVSEEDVSTEMLSFNGELVQIMRAASDSAHPSHEMLKTVQAVCQYTDVVKWDDLDVI